MMIEQYFTLPSNFFLILGLKSLSYNDAYNFYREMSVLQRFLNEMNLPNVHHIDVDNVSLNEWEFMELEFSVYCLIDVKNEIENSFEDVKIIPDWQSWNRLKLVQIINEINQS